MLLNADLGEGMPLEASMIPYLQMGSISCGAHAGDELLIRNTLRQCAAHRVLVGAHPSYEDRAHFGRLEISLPPEQLCDRVVRQLTLFREWAHAESVAIQFVKPHGALYNVSARDRIVARMVAEAVRRVDPTWALMGLAGSVSLDEAKTTGLTVYAEAFADRRYLADGRLCPRTDSRALIEDPMEVIEQVRSITVDRRVRTVDGAWIPVDAAVVCVHGDGAQSVLFSKGIRELLDSME